ncbi:MAG: hypothetical protein GY807_03455 [Gammaproteobacteria bacterium]|nr:hypothetical protein [Gammaproteobacteria bacterium]
MRRTNSAEILSEVYSARIDSTLALIAASESGSDALAALSPAATKLDQAAEHYGEAVAGHCFAALAEFVRIVEFLIKWRMAVVEAEPEADRFLRAAKERSTVWLNAHSTAEHLRPFGDIAATIDKISDVGEVTKICSSLAGVPLPISVYHIPPKELGVSRSHEEMKKMRPKLSVAFLEFVIDGTPVSDIHYVQPGISHDLEISVRVSRWPTNAERLNLKLVTAEPRTHYEFPEFTFAKPPGIGPFELTATERAILRVPHAMNARPFEFKYTAEFEPLNAEQPVEVAGQRALKLEGVDFQHEPQTGYPNVDQKIIAVRNQLRALPLVPEAEISECLVLTFRLGNIAGQALQGATFPGVWSEPKFQDELVKKLRTDPSIGAELEEHPHAAGGKCDLSFRGMKIELKSEPDRRLNLEDCNQFIEQLGSYVVGSGKRLGILCVLDCSPKTAGAYPAEDGIGILFRKGGESTLPVVTIIIQGNLPRPSDLSKSKSRKKKPATRKTPSQN